MPIPEYTITMKFKRALMGSEQWITNITPKMSKADAQLLYDDVGLECPKEFEKSE